MKWKWQEEILRDSVASRSVWQRKVDAEDYKYLLTEFQEIVLSMLVKMQRLHKHGGLKIKR